MDLPPEAGARGQPRAEVAGGRERAATPCFSGLLWGEPQLHSPLPPASVALFQRFTSQLSGGQPGCLGGTQLLPRAHFGPQDRNTGSLPSTRHSRHRAGTSMASARRSALPALEGSAGPWVSLCSSAPGDTVGSTCTPRLGLRPPQGPERRAGQRLPQHSGGARQAFFTRLVRFRTGLPGTFSMPAVPLAPKEGLQSLPRRGQRGVSGEAGGGPTFAGAGVAPSSSVSLSRGCLLRTLAPGHVPPAFLQPRC